MDSYTRFTGYVCIKSSTWTRIPINGRQLKMQEIRVGHSANHQRIAYRRFHLLTFAVSTKKNPTYSLWHQCRILRPDYTTNREEEEE